MSDIFHNEGLLNIKRIAVCLYGQYRTGDICLDYIKKFYEISGYQVDFFCSLKPYNTTYTRHLFNEKNEKPPFQIVEYSQDVVEKNTATIKHKLNPKKFKLYTTEYESKLKNIKRSIMHSKVLAGWIDSIMLKTMYEVENNITYDMVVMQRYDVILYPRNGFRVMVKSLDGTSVSRRDTFRTNNKDFLLVNPIQFYRSHPGIFCYANAQDLWAVGFGTALDTIAYEALNHISSKFNSMYDIRKFYNGYPFVDTHEMVATIANKMNIPMFAFGAVKEDESGGTYTLPFQNNFDYSYRHRGYAPLPIRDTYFENSEFSPDSLIELTDDELEKFYSESAIKWHVGL